ncbi:E3 ubiquitin-protein ligase RNF180 isoform X2 [Myripristis murdjan]|uniref:E3 ubiquitin-protein ligase RNF180 n=1 Tax=Myripristis murdjan TaxID=586833 RepID=A0A667X031_9TELE|nr:E3 ubiquitin-protein ligase RNF180 isoform X2 [Myripristis murdjan]
MSCSTCVFLCFQTAFLYSQDSRMLSSHQNWTENLSMDSPRGITMLRCRRCRKSFIDSTCLYPIDTTDDSTAAVCSIWHVNVDTLPEWILTSVHQAQWTVGKLNCQNCGARLGGFNFINHSRCPCGQDITVHLSKSRVDHDHRHSVHMVQPRRTRPERGPAGLQRGTEGSEDEEGKPELNTLACLQLNCAVMSRVDPDTQATARADASPQLTETEATKSFPLQPLYSISHRKKSSLDLDTSSRSLDLCPAGPVDKPLIEIVRTRTDESAHSPVLYHAIQQLETVAEGSFNSVACYSAVSRERRSLLDRQQLPAVESLGSSTVTSADHEEVSDSPMFLRGRTISDSIAEQEEDVMPQATSTSPASNRLSKRERNRLKSQRRKQRRRERWLHSQLEQEQTQSVSGLLTDSEEEDRDGYTCAVCLDVYYSPYSCQPCGHIFCEPCLRTLAKNRPTNTPCPLCRTLISHTHFQKELNQTAKTFFPKVYQARKLNFQKATCAKWPLPNCRKRFRIFWGYQRQAATAGRRWRFAPAGFTLDALDLADMRGWLFDMDLVIIYIHSINWILALLILMLIYFFFS